MLATNTRIELLKYERPSIGMKAEFYDLTRQTYDSVSREFTKKNIGIADFIGDEIVRATSHVPRPCRAIDIGCGGGVYTAFMGVLGFHVLGIDISAAQIHLGASANLPHNVRFMHANALNVPLPPDSMDFILINSMFHHIIKDDRPAFLMRVKRALKDNGSILLITRAHGESYEALIKERKLGRMTQRYAARSTVQELDDTFAQAGFSFEVLHSEPHSDDPDGVFRHYLLRKHHPDLIMANTRGRNT